MIGERVPQLRDRVALTLWAGKLWSAISVNLQVRQLALDGAVLRRFTAGSTVAQTVVDLHAAEIEARARQWP